MDNLFSSVNGTILPAANASLLVTDLSVQRGYGIFDFFKLVNGRTVFLDDHLDRFFHSASFMSLDTRLNRETVTSQINELIRKNQLPESGIRLTLTGGYSADGYSLADPNLIITQQPLVLSRNMQPGIKLVMHYFQRQLPVVKTIDYLMAVWLQPHIKKMGASDVLYISDEVVRECPRANFFIVREDGTVQTTVNDILKGITRKHVLEISSRHFNTETKDISLTDLVNAKEAFITSTTKHVLPVVEVNGVPVGTGLVGETTRFIGKLFNQKVFEAN